MSDEEMMKIQDLDKKIDKLKDQVFQKRREYDELTEKLKNLLEERYPERKEERIKESLYDAYRKSGRSIEDVITVILNIDELNYY